MFNITARNMTAEWWIRAVNKKLMTFYSLKDITYSTNLQVIPIL